MILKKMKNFKIKVLGISETYWSKDLVDTYEIVRYVFIQSTRQYVALAVERELSNCIIS